MANTLPELRKEDGNYINLKGLITKEFPKNEDCVYVDHAAAALYSKSQMKDVFSGFSNHFYGNPHSRHGPSDLSTQAIDAIRSRVLDFFNTDSKKYSCIFTHGATAAIKLVGECFQWKDPLSRQSKNVHSKEAFHGTFVYTKENHTSILGVREYAKLSGSRVLPISVNQLRHHLELDNEVRDDADSKIQNSLLAYPAQCNYSGGKYPLEWIDKVHSGKLNSILKLGEDPHEWYVLLDAAGYTATSHLDLDKYSPDFVPISFYKIFGYPTGLGCLLVSKRGEQVLHKNYFGGGTVAMVDASSPTVHKRSELHERFEDGSLSFLSIISLDFGFLSIENIAGGIEAIEKHVFHVANYFYSSLKRLKHLNGRPAAEIYCESEDWTWDNQGGIVNFNLIDDNNRYIGYSQIEKISSLFNVYLRTGCMCNPGACQRFLNISSKLLEEQFDAGHVCGDTIDLVDNRPTGSVRVSFGYSSTYDDADKVLKMITECFIKNNGPSSVIDKKLPHSTKQDNSAAEETDTSSSLEDQVVPLELTDILVYPVKSCGPMLVDKWDVGNCGMLFDRHWMVITTTGITITQKRIPKMALIFPRIDLKRHKLILTCQDSIPCEVPLESLEDETDVQVCSGRVCGDRIKGIDCGQVVANWLTEILGCDDVRLLRMTSGRVDSLHKNSNGEPQSISLSNESQFVVVNRPSLKLLLKEILSKGDEEEIDVNELILRFRPNLVVEGGSAFSEDSWKQINIGGHTFNVKGPCRRCQIVCVSPMTGQRSKEPLLTLSSMRGSSAQFGLHAFHSNDGSSGELCIGTKGFAFIN